MRKPIRIKGQPRQQVSGVFSLSSPVGGWNARDSIAGMGPADAIKLLNWYPTTTDCESRGGQSDHATGITGTVKTLAVYNAMSGTNKLFAADENDVWNVSSAGAATAQSATVTNGKFQYVNFGDGTNNWLIMVNGVDKPLYYNGSSWVSVDAVSSPALTGLTTTQIVNVTVYKERLFFVEKSSLSFWYLAANAAGGALTEFDLSSLAKKGGYLMWAANWSFDGGDGPDDAIAFMTSEGEVIVYRGTNPSTASDWVLAGIYEIGKPLGRRSHLRLAGDLIAITQNGVFNLSNALLTASATNKAAMSDKIEKAFTAAARDYGSNFGWEGIVYPLRSAVLFNIPVAEGGTHKQYVMNSITKAWCEFDSWNAECFAVFNNELYYGESTAVRKAWTGYSDDGSNITFVGKTAFNYFGNTSQQKRFTLFRPLLQVNGSISFLTGMDVDFTDNDITGLASYSVTTRAQWDVDNWDETYWAAGLEVVRKWTSPIENVGYCVSGSLKIEANDLEIHWVADDFVYEQGGVI